MNLHYAELRNRIIKSLLVVLAIFIVLFIYARPLYTFVARPILSQLPANSTMIATQVTAPFLIPLKLSFMCAILLGVPYIIFQAWAFVAPGLYKHEKKKILPTILASITLFYLGLIFAFKVISPLALTFFTQQAPEGVQVMTDISHYLDFLMLLLLATGFGFQIPIITIGIVKLKIVSRETLIKKRPWIIVATFTLGMLLTPPDVLSQVLLAVPMWLLFEVGILLTKVRQ